MKKLITSKPFLLGVLAALSAGVLAVCLLWNGGENKEFIPAPPSAAEATDSWTENRPSFTVGAYMENENGGLGSNKQDAKEEKYPQIVAENENEVVISFTDPNPVKAQAPNHPGTPSDNVSHENVPVQTPSIDGKPQETPKPQAPGSEGQVYDPVFGWVTPGKVVVKQIDSPGDLNKMVGTMD